MGAKITKYTTRRAEFGDDYPDPTDNEMVVVYENGVPYMIDFLCPCGCGSKCPIHLVPPGEQHKERRWEFDAATLKLTPSVRFLSGCKAHFNIEDGGVVKMHDDSGK